MAMRGNFICKKNYLLSRVVLLAFFPDNFRRLFWNFYWKNLRQVQNLYQ